MINADIYGIIVDVEKLHHKLITNTWKLAFIGRFQKSLGDGAVDCGMSVKLSVKKVYRFRC